MRMYIWKCNHLRDRKYLIHASYSCIQVYLRIYRPETHMIHVYVNASWLWEVWHVPSQQKATAPCSCEVIKSEKKSWCIEAWLGPSEINQWLIKKRVWTTRTHTRTGHLSGKYISWLAPVNMSIQYLGLESKGAGCLRRAKTWHQYNQQIWATGATYINYNPKKNIVEPVELLKHVKN